MSHRYTVVASPPNPFDVRYATVEKPGALPRRASLAQFNGPVRNQEQEGSCSAFSGCYVVENLYRHYRNDAVVLAPAFLYEAENIIQGTPGQDKGSALVVTQYALQTLGVCPEADDRYTPQDFFVRLTAKMLEDARRYRVGQGYLAATLAEVLHAVADGYPPQLGVLVYESFESADAAKTGHVPMPGPAERCLGGHGLEADSYDLDRGWVSGLNSWSEAWGDKGRWYLPLDYFRSPHTFQTARIYTLG